MRNQLVFKGNLGRFFNCSASALKIIILCFAGASALMSEVRAEPKTAGWEFTARPYLWLGAGKATADLSAINPGASADLTELSLSTSSLIDGIRLGGMSAIEARRSGYVFILDGAYGKFALAGSSIDPNFDGTTLDVKAWLFHVLAGRDILHTEELRLSVIGGLRIFDTNFTFNAPQAPPNPPIEIPIVKDTFIDPVIGTIGSIAITDRISVNLYGDVGGFGASSNLTWQFFGSVDFDITNSVSLDIGYRRIKWNVDEQENETLREFQGSGPVVGLQWRF